MRAQQTFQEVLFAVILRVCRYAVSGAEGVVTGPQEIRNSDFRNCLTNSTPASRIARKLNIKRQFPLFNCDCLSVFTEHFGLHFCDAAHSEKWTNCKPMANANKQTAAFNFQYPYFAIKLLCYLFSISLIKLLQQIRETNCDA